MILFNDYNKIDVWLKFCHELEIEIIAEIYSDYYGKEDTVEMKEKIITGSINYLERGVDVSKRNCIRVLANHLVRLTNKEIR